MVKSARAPRPYTTVERDPERDGYRVVWVAPEEKRPDWKMTRSRRETDNEVRARILLLGKSRLYGVDIRGMVGDQLDRLLKVFNLDARKWIEE